MPKNAPVNEDAGKGDLKKLRKIMKAARIGMLTTVAPDGNLHSRPMATLDAPFDGYLWFFTRASSPKADEIQENQRVNVSYTEGDRNVSVAGTATLSRDPERIKDLWSGWLKAWFPQGKKDPDLAILRVRVEHAEYWDAKSSTMVQMVGLLKGVIAGRSTEGQAAENRKVALNDSSSPANNPTSGAQG